jgi:hypothetical protein
MNPVRGNSFIRYAFMFTPDVVRQIGYTFGDSTFGAELALFNPRDPQECYAVANIANNKMGWSAPGYVVWAFPAQETAGWSFKQAGFYLDLIAPAPLLDPTGNRFTVLNGLLNVQAHAN